MKLDNKLSQISLKLAKLFPPVQVEDFADRHRQIDTSRQKNDNKGFLVALASNGTLSAVAAKHLYHVFTAWPLLSS